MKFVLTLIFFLSLITLLITFLSSYFNWKSNKNNKVPDISFPTFLHFYQIAPDQWSWRDWEHCVYYLRKEKAADFYYVVKDKVEFKSYWDIIQFHFFKKDVDKKRSGEEKDRATMRLIKGVQKDIDEWNEEMKRWCNRG